MENQDYLKNVIGKPKLNLNPQISVASILALNPCAKYTEEKLKELFEDVIDLDLKSIISVGAVPYQDYLWLVSKLFALPKYTNFWIKWEEGLIKSAISKNSVKPVLNTDIKKWLDELNNKIETLVLKVSLKDPVRHALYVADKVCDSAQDRVKNNKQEALQKQEKINLQLLMDLLK